METFTGKALSRCHDAEMETFTGKALSRCHDAEMETFTGKALSRCHDAEMETLHWKEQEGLLQFFICLSSGSSVALLALLKIKVSKGLFCCDATK